MAVEGLCLIVSSLPEQTASKHRKRAAFSNPRRSMPGGEIGGTQAKILSRAIVERKKLGRRPEDPRLANPNLCEILF